jgi:hypothetical protein
MRNLGNTTNLLLFFAFLALTGLIGQPPPLSAGTNYEFKASEKIEQWKLNFNDGQGSGNLTLIKKPDGNVTADGDWIYTYQGDDVSASYSGAPVTIAGSSISITTSGIATNPSAPPGYQTSPFTSVVSGKACNGRGSGTFTTTFTTYGWPPSLSGSWEGTRTSGSGITAISATPGIPLLLLDN